MESRPDQGLGLYQGRLKGRRRLGGEPADPRPAQFQLIALRRAEVGNHLDGAGRMARGLAGADDEQVRAGAAAQGIGPGAAPQSVRPRAGRERVRAGAAGQAAVPCGSGEGVAAVLASQRTLSHQDVGAHAA